MDDDRVGFGSLVCVVRASAFANRRCPEARISVSKFQRLYVHSAVRNALLGMHCRGFKFCASVGCQISSMYSHIDRHDKEMSS